jgi:hypothetical protein
MRANHQMERNMRGLFVLIAVSLALPSMAEAQSNPLSLQDTYASKYGTTPLKTKPATTPPVFHSAASKFEPGAKDLPAQPTGSQTDQKTVTATTTTVAPAVDPPQPAKSDGRFHLSKFGKHLFTVVDALGQVGQEVPDEPAVSGVRGASAAAAAMPTPTGGDLQPAPVAPQPAYTVPGQSYSAPTVTPTATPGAQPVTPVYQAPTPNAKVIKTGP